MTQKKRLIPFVIIVIMITGFALGATSAAAHGASLTSGATGKSEIHYLGKSKDGKGWKNPHCSWGNQFKYIVKTGDGKKVAYCMEPGKDFKWWHKYTARDLAKAKVWTRLPEARQRVLAQVLYYGYNSGKAAPYGNSNDYYAATQVLVWEAVDGDIKLSEKGKWSKTANRHDNLIAGRKYAEKNYRWIKDKISAHVKGAGFAAADEEDAKTYLMHYSYKTKSWTRTLTDTDKGNYLKLAGALAGKVDMSRKGYEYKFSTKTSGTKKVKLVNSTKAGTSQPLMVFTPSKSGDQALIFGAADKVAFYVKLRTEKTGTGKIVKTSDDGKAAGFNFKVTCSSNGYSKVHKTNSKGLISAALYPGEYKVTEQLTTAQKKAGYTAAKTRTIVIKEGKTSQIKVHNNREKEEYKVVKTSDTGIVSGFKFVIKDSSGKTVASPVTGEDGVIKGSLYPGTYTVTEVLTEEQKEDGYVQPASKQIVITAGQKSAAVVKFHNTILKQGNIIIRKSNADGTSPAGFKFEIENLDTGEKVECVTGEDGTSDISQLEAGTYKVTEILSEEEAAVFEQPESQTVEIKADSEPIVVEFVNVPKTTPVELKKISSDGNVAGLEFSISGTLTDGNPYGPFTGTTDEKGFLDFGELLPGEYIIEEAFDGANRYEAQEPKVVTVTGNEEEPIVVEYENVLNHLHIKKTDSSTGALLDGAEFAIYGEAEKEVASFRVTVNDGRVSLEMISEETQGVIVDDECGDGSYGCLRGLSESAAYRLVESAAPQGYIAAPEQEFVFKTGLMMDIKNDAEPAVVEETEAAEPDDPEPVPATEPEPAEEVVTDHVAATGDDGGDLLPFCLAAIALIVTIMLFFRREKEE